MTAMTMTVATPAFRIAAIERRQRCAIIRPDKTQIINETVTRYEITIPSIVVVLADKLWRKAGKVAERLTEAVDQTRLTVAVVGSVLGCLIRG